MHIPQINAHTRACNTNLYLAQFTLWTSRLQVSRKQDVDLHITQTLAPSFSEGASVYFKGLRVFVSLAMPSRSQRTYKDQVCFPVCCFVAIIYEISESNSRVQCMAAHPQTTLTPFQNAT